MKYRGEVTLLLRLFVTSILPDIQKYMPNNMSAKTAFFSFFSHPDCTVGFGFAPNHANARAYALIYL